MTKSTLMSYLTGMVFFVMTWTTAMAHVSHIEPQAARSAGVCEATNSPEFCTPDAPAGSPEEDFSFEHPFVMAPTFGVDFFIHDDHEDGEAADDDGHDDDDEFIPGQGPNIEISKAIHAYLSTDPNGGINGDVDWFKFVLDHDELFGFDTRTNGVEIVQGTALASANAIPWRCAKYTDSFPTIALIGPGLPEVDELGLAALPFEVQDALNSKQAKKGKWGIFVSEHAGPSIPRRSSDFTSGINTEWWSGNPAFTFFDGGSPQSRFRGALADGPALSIEGTYHIVVWDPYGNPLDYTLSTGFWEQPTEAEDILGDGTRLLFDNDMLLNFQCNDPCDGVQDSGYTGVAGSIGRMLSVEEADLAEELFKVPAPGGPPIQNCDQTGFPGAFQDGICGCIRGV